MKKTRQIRTRTTPRLRLVQSSKGSKRCQTKAAPRATSLSSQPTPLQQEALILKYRIKARKLGRSMLRRWQCRMDLDEVDSLVDLSLCETVKRFDPSKGASFMTFFFYHLKGNLVRAVASAAAATTVPLSLLETFDGGGTTTDSTGGRAVAGYNAIDIAEAVSGQDVPQPDEALWMKQVNDCSVSACEKLDALEREIIKRLFVQEQQIIDIAAALGYSRCHVSRIKKKALSTLHDELSVVMNQDDYSAIESVEPEHVMSLRKRISHRREVQRRRPRSHGQRDADMLTDKAA